MGGDGVLREHAAERIVERDLLALQAGDAF